PSAHDPVAKYSSKMGTAAAASPASMTATARLTSGACRSNGRDGSKPHPAKIQERRSTVPIAAAALLAAALAADLAADSALVFGPEAEVRLPTLRRSLSGKKTSAMSKRSVAPSG